jgi:DUF971 family protein
VTSEPEQVAISKSRGIKIDWKDGHHSEYGLRYLRDHCPCASCSGTHPADPAEAAEPSPFQMFQPVLRIEAVEPAGSYALAIQWNDGHRSGIYSYEYLRAICPCDECAQENPS